MLLLDTASLIAIGLFLLSEIIPFLTQRKVHGLLHLFGWVLLETSKQLSSISGNSIPEIIEEIIPENEKKNIEYRIDQDSTRS